MQILKKHRIDKLEVQLSREELRRRSRILIVDDEKPELIEDLGKAGFSVDYQPDITKDNMHVIERPTYDLLVLDFGNVGAAFGPDQGLSLLRHIRRVNPSIVVLAYTSKSLGTEHADFFRVADGVLSKDAGITESMEKIEESLAKALSIQNLWAGMLNVVGVQPGSKKDLEWQDLYVRGLNKQSKLKDLKQKVAESVGGEGALQIGLLILDKLIDLGMKAAMGV